MLFNAEGGIHACRRRPETLTGDEIDLYETPRSATEAIVPLLRQYFDRETIFWECCDGNGAISSVLLENGFTVVKSDRYFGEERHDFLSESDLPPHHFDVIVTNPPYAVKHEFIARAVKYGVPFLFLLPLQVLGTLKSKGNLKNCNCSLLPIAPSPSFLHDGIECSIGEVGWFIGNMAQSELQNRLFLV